jgi:hypothetical protein
MRQIFMFSTGSVVVKQGYREEKQEVTSRYKIDKTLRMTQDKTTRIKSCKKACNNCFVQLTRFDMSRKEEDTIYISIPLKQALLSDLGRPRSNKIVTVTPISNIFYMS